MGQGAATAGGGEGAVTAGGGEVVVDRAGGEGAVTSEVAAAENTAASADSGAAADGKSAADKQAAVQKAAAAPPGRGRAVDGWVHGSHIWPRGFAQPTAAPPELDSRKQQLLEQQAWDGGSVGWVLLVHQGKKLVTTRVKLGPDSRRQYVRQWARRKANDKTEKQHPGALRPHSLNLELASDPHGIGFGFGGVEPGTLHARGELYETHSVYYSVGLAGDYLLHVRVRVGLRVFGGDCIPPRRGRSPQSVHSPYHSHPTHRTARPTARTLTPPPHAHRSTISLSTPHRGHSQPPHLGTPHL